MIILIGQLIISGKNEELEKFALYLKIKKLKILNFQLSAPFHCELMRDATNKMEKLINEQNLKILNYKVVSNVTALEYKNKRK